MCYISDYSLCQNPSCTTCMNHVVTLRGSQRLYEQIEDLQRTRTQKDETNRRKDTELKSKDATIKRKETEIWTKDAKITEQEARLGRRDAEIKTKDAEIRRLEEKVKAAEKKFADERDDYRRLEGRMLGGHYCGRETGGRAGGERRPRLLHDVQRFNQMEMRLDLPGFRYY